MSSIETKTRERVHPGTRFESLDHLLERMCSTDPLRKTMHTPSLEGGVVMATSGKVGAEVPVHMLKRTYSKVEDYPPLGRILDKTFSGEPVATISLHAVQEAIAAVPRTPMYATCTECDGSGSAMCPCCGHADSCDVCGGGGRHADQVVGETWKSEHYVHLLRSHFDPRYLHLFCEAVRLLGEKDFVAHMPMDGTYSVPQLGAKVGPARLVVMPIGGTGDVRAVKVKVPKEV